MGLKLIKWGRSAFRRVSIEAQERSGIHGTWIDVGAHSGEKTLSHARLNPNLRVFAFEPNLRVAARLMGAASNFLVIPVALAETDGVAEFHINAFEAASSLLPLNQEGLQSWIGRELLKAEATVIVPTMRLDTFMNLAGIDTVDFLKVDAQGMDLAVIKSAGLRLQDIAKLTLEVAVTEPAIYSGAPSKTDVLAFLNEAGFVLVDVEKQTYGQEENLTFVQASPPRSDRRVFCSPMAETR
jgi:FkbM family methyltransferase